MSKKTKSAPKILAKAKGAGSKASPKASPKSASKAPHKETPKVTKGASKAASKATPPQKKAGKADKAGKKSSPAREVGVKSLPSKGAAKATVKPEKAPQLLEVKAATQATAKAGLGAATKEAKAKLATGKASTQGSPLAAIDSNLTEEDLRFASEVEADVEAESGGPTAIAADEIEATEPDDKAEKKAKKRDEIKIDRTGNLENQWKTIFERSKAVKPVAYKMSENYEARTALMHKVLGWGYVLTSQNNRLEVLFKDGIKFLIANYKS
jgi:hypothetical protein